MAQWTAQAYAADLSIPAAVPNAAAREQRRRAQLQTLYATALHVMARLGSNDLPRVVLDHACALLGTRRGALYCIAHDGQAVLAACVPGQRHEGALAQIDAAGLARSVAARHLPLLITCAQDGREPCADTEQPVLIGIPLRWLGQAVGVILIDDQADHSVDADDLRLLGLFADLATLALMQNARFCRNTPNPDAAGEQAAEAPGELSKALQAIIQQAQPLCETCIATMSAAERERTRIAHDLHDSIRQSLVGVQLQLEAAWAALHQSDSAHAAQLLRAGQETLAAADAEMRQVVYDLHTPALAEGGLAAAIRACAARWQSITGIAVSLELSEVTAPAPVATALYRIVQEALANVARHAQAHQLRISLRHEAEYVTLHIADDGRGGAAARAGGLGMSSMRERARAIGATFELASPPGGGTSITVALQVG